MAEILTHIAFYARWPNAWAAFTLAKEVYNEAAADESGHGGFFGMGSPNDGFAQYFSGRSWLNPVSGVDAYLPIFTSRLSLDAATTGTRIALLGAADRF